MNPARRFQNGECRRAPHVKGRTPVYKHILLPTDGSALSKRAIEGGIRLAKSVGARVTAVHVTPKVAATALEQWARGESGRRSRLAAIFDGQAKQYVAEIAAAAERAGVPCGCVRVRGESPHEEILKTAANRGCDLIYMASHGKRGTSALLLGSETAKVLTHSPIPVLVHRERRRPPIASRVRLRAEY